MRPHQSLGVEETQFFVGNAHIDHGCFPLFTIQVDAGGLVADDLHPVGAVMLHQMGQLGVPAVLILADDGGQGASVR